MELIIELPGRGVNGHELQKVNADSIRIGRGFDNEIILTDPHVCAHHAVIEQLENGQIQIRDLASANGTFAQGGRRLDSPQAIESGDVFYLGKTKLRVYWPDHEVPASLNLTWVENLAHVANRPLMAIAFCLAVILLTLFQQYALELSEFKLARELLTAFGVLIMIMLWPAGWTLLSRYKKHEPRFRSHLTAILLFVIILSVIEKFDAWLIFHLGDRVWLDAINIILYLALLMLLLRFHLYLSGVLNNKRGWVLTSLITALLASVMYVGLGLEKDRFKSRPEYTAILFPPAVSLYKTETDNDFLADAETLFDEAEQLAADATSD